MVNNDKVYVYTGSEEGYINGNWYYYDGNTWVSGGIYNSTAIATDTTLTVEGRAADAKKTGDKITQLKDDLIYIENNTLVVNNPSKPSEGGYDELVNIFDPNDLARTGSIYIESTTPSIYTNAAFYQSGAIKTTPGETLQCIGQMNGTTDFWVAVLSTNDATSLSNVVRCYQVYPSRTYDGTISYAEIVVPDDAEWMSFSGLNRKNMGLIKINRTVHIPGPTYVNRIKYNGMDTPVKGLTTDFTPENLFDESEMTSGILFITGSNGQPAIYTGSNIGNFFQSAPIAVTEGETLAAYGNMNNAIDFWASVLNDDSSVTLENVKECFRIYPQKSINSKSYAIFKVPTNAQWISVSGAVYNAQLVQIYRLDDTAIVAKEYDRIYELRDPFAIHFDKNITLSEEQKATARTALGIVGSDGNTVTPQAYGALGDGVHDDTEAIQAALNSSAKKIYLPPGGYRITDSLVISSGSKYLMGDGSNVARIIPDDECGDAIIINETATGTHLHGFLIETTNNEDAYAIRINNTQRVSISFVDNLGGSFRQSKSKWLHQEGNTWSTLMVYHCIVDCGTLDDWGAELINTSESARVCDVHLNDIFLDTVLATSGGCLRVDNCGDVHIQNSLYRTKAGTCLQMDNNSRVINEMSVLETFTANKPSVVVNSGTFQNRGGWNDKYD